MAARKRRRSGKRKSRRAGKRRARRTSTAMVVYKPRARRRVRRTRGRRSQARRYVANRGASGRKRARTYRVRNRHGKPLFHVRGWRARRANPSTDGLVVAAIAVGVGLTASITVGYVVDKFMANRSPAMQTAALAVVAAGVAFFVPNPAISAGVATGLLVVPLAKQVYTWLPALANPAVPPALAPSGAPAALSPTAPAMQQAGGSAPPSSTSGMAPVSSSTTGLTGMHGGFVRRHNKLGKAKPYLNALHMGALHRSSTPVRAMNALHMHGIAALHERGMGGSLRRGR
jgi:hypothetical protein